MGGEPRWLERSGGPLPPTPLPVKNTPKKVFNSLAVLLKNRVESELFAQVLRKAREKVSLRELGIDKSWSPFVAAVESRRFWGSLR